MAVRYSSGAEGHTSTAGLPGAVFTVTMWLWPAVIPTARYQFATWLDQGGGASFAAIGIRNNATNDLQLADGGTHTFSGVNPLSTTQETWYRAAAVVNGANATFYRSSASDALSSASVTDFSPPSTPSTWYLGDTPFDEWFNGRVAAFKAWDAALSQAEVEAELAQYVPRRVANLLHFHPFMRAETTDYSGNGNSLTGTGSTTEDGPPIPWRVSSPRLVLPAAPPAATTSSMESGGRVIPVWEATEPREVWQAVQARPVWEATEL